MEDAFRQAWCDQTTRDRYFLTPLALEHRKRPEPTGSDDHNRPPQLSKKQRKAEKKKEQAQMQKKGDGKGKARGSCLAVRLTRLTARKCVSTLTRRIWCAAVVEVALLPTCAGVASKWARQCKAVTTKGLERPGAQKESQQEEVATTECCHRGEWL